MTPIWIGMPADYGTINPGRLSGQLPKIDAVASGGDTCLLGHAYRSY
ncbi:MAG TPA: hypothetical protein VEV41_10710 [Terriglobales bacterium]|nr:hypothetical protein [Terriglobales bacterium]